jgi:hypothetical protein
MWKSNELGKYSTIRLPVSIRPGGPVQAKGVGVRVGGCGEGVGGTEEAVLVGVGAGGCVGAGVRVADGVETLGKLEAVGVKVPAAGETATSWLDEQAASPKPSHRLDANSATAFTIFPIS